jgi:hypothetical protein
MAAKNKIHPSISEAISPIRISPLTFKRQFDRFKSKIRHHSNGQPFTSFRDGLPADWEDYKEDVRDEARRRLSFGKWKHNDIGKGLILKCVINAIEILEPSRNNLVAWLPKYGPKSRAHLVLLNARKSSTDRRAFEQLFIDFFHDRIAEGEAFRQFRQLGITRYDLVAYLFFLKDWRRFMPIAPKKFDEAFKLLGVELVLTKHCSWENYLSFNTALLDVQSLLREVGEVSDARLIDAHSFCWMLVDPELDLPAAIPAPIIPLPRMLANIQSISPKFADTDPDDDHEVITEEQFAIRDAQRRRLGRLAQDVARQSEQRRLRELGHPNPSQSVRPVWDEPRRGYDILSCERDNSPRHIEVKATRKSGDKLSFYLSRNEWEQSRKKENYWFYLVLNTESSRPEVLMVASKKLSLECLAPVNYLAALRVGGNSKP